MPGDCAGPLKKAKRMVSYGELSRELGLSQHFTACSPPSEDFFLGSAPTIEQMATFREARTVQAHGPYVLSGWSLGGLVAWEMAQQLRKEGARNSDQLWCAGIEDGACRNHRRDLAAFYIDEQQQRVAGCESGNEPPWVDRRRKSAHAMKINPFWTECFALFYDLLG
jgi:hypothetical protein